MVKASKKSKQISGWNVRITWMYYHTIMDCGHAFLLFSRLSLNIRWWWHIIKSFLLCRRQNLSLFTPMTSRIILTLRAFFFARATRITFKSRLMDDSTYLSGCVSLFVFIYLFFFFFYCLESVLFIFHFHAHNWSLGILFEIYYVI